MMTIRVIGFDPVGVLSIMLLVVVELAGDCDGDKQDPYACLRAKVCGGLLDEFIERVWSDSNQ